MRVVVMGGGIVGVTTAHCLAADGHEVTVLERRDAVAQETSFANAGLMAPGHAYAWSSPRAPMTMLRSLYRDDQALRFKLRPDPRLWAWTWLFLRQCNAKSARINTLRKHRLCVYSQQVFKALTAETPLAFDGSEQGLLYLYRSQESFERGAANIGILVEDGQELEVVDRQRAAEIDPALEPVKEQIAGAVFAPTDGSGDARLFSEALAERLQSEGVRFAFGTSIERIEAEGDRVTGVVTDKGRFEAEAYVLALGCFSPALAKPLGLDLPIYPVKGYSVTLPSGGNRRRPTVGGVDEDNLIAYAPLGDRLRITATAEFSGFDTSHTPADFRVMLKAARALFPDGGDWDQPTYWAGLRPMTPEGTPFLGPARQKNLFLNCGHGHMGWTMACGTARITADLIAGRPAEIDLAGLTLH